MTNPKKRSADQNDIENVEAWAEVIEDVLNLVPPDLRAAALALATKSENAARKEREANAGLLVLTAAELENMDTPGLRHWGAIMRLKSLLVQVFVRNITNNHSPKDAAHILFAQHDYGHGSGMLQDYLDDLPRHIG
jgi:hypothetical protein